MWRVEGEKKRSWRTSGGCWRISKGRPADRKDGEVVGKRPLDKGGKGGGTGVFGRGSEGGGVSWEGARRLREERIRGRKASRGGGRRTGTYGAAGGRGFALGVRLLGKLRQGVPGVSGRKKVAPGRNEPGRKHSELEFTL